MHELVKTLPHPHWGLAVSLGHSGWVWSVTVRTQMCEDALSPKQCWWLKSMHTFGCAWTPGVRLPFALRVGAVPCIKN